MSIQDLGSIGELISAIAVVASLLYLGYQVKQTNVTVRTDNYLRFSEYISKHQTMMTDIELARIWLVGLDRPEDQTRRGSFESA